ncbi:MAG TPA: hypothetical protein VND93_12890 [Myxococcales bacterium]|nr:hypothetical protein [Myxococcales bacterium]
MNLLLLAALAAAPVPVHPPAPAPAARGTRPAAAPADPLPRGSRILVVNAALATPAVDERAASRGWKVDSAPSAGPALVAARAFHPKLLVVSSGAVDAPRLAALRGAAPGSRVILTQHKGEALPDLPEAAQAQVEVLPAPYERAALEAAVARAFAPRAPLSQEEKTAQKERKERARRIAALTVDRILAMAEPLEGEDAALEQLLDRLQRKAAGGPERLTPPEVDLLLASSALALGLDGYATRAQGDRANEAGPALRRVGFDAEAAALAEAYGLLARRGRLGSAVDRLQAREALDRKERARWGELAAVLDRARAGAGKQRATHLVLEYARAQRKALRLDGRPTSVASAGASP